MDAAEFDRFADEYGVQLRSTIAITGEAPSYFAAYKIRLLAETLRAGANRLYRDMATSELTGSDVA
jgi:hypothetical protein